MDASMPPIPKLCAACKGQGATVVETLPLCTTCRSNFRRLKMPDWLKAALAFLVVIFLYCLVRLPLSVSAMFHSDQNTSGPADHAGLPSDAEEKP
jgi:hypothetical protein